MTTDEELDGHNQSEADEDDDGEGGPDNDDERWSGEPGVLQVGERWLSVTLAVDTSSIEADVARKYDEEHPAPVGATRDELQSREDSKGEIAQQSVKDLLAELAPDLRWHVTNHAKYVPTGDPALEVRTTGPGDAYLYLLGLASGATLLAAGLKSQARRAQMLDSACNVVSETGVAVGAIDWAPRWLWS